MENLWHTSKVTSHNVLVHMPLLANTQHLFLNAHPVLTWCKNKVYSHIASRFCGNCMVSVASKNCARTRHSFALFLEVADVTEEHYVKPLQEWWLMQPRAALGRPQRSVNRKRTSPEEGKKHVADCGESWARKQLYYSQGSRASLGLKSRPRPWLQAQPQCCHQVLLLRVAWWVEGG